LPQHWRWNCCASPPVKKWYSVHGNRKGIRGIEIGTSFIPTDPDGRIRLYYSPPDPRRRVSALAILKGEVDAAVFLNKVALIGLTAVGFRTSLLRQCLP